MRSEYKGLIVDDNLTLNALFIQVEHTGFATVVHSAVLKYFDFYNLKYTDIPLAEIEFRNPLFLRMFCLGFSGKKIDWTMLSISDVYQRYLNEINRVIAEKLNYSKYDNVVELVLDKIVECKHQPIMFVSLSCVVITFR